MTEFEQRVIDLLKLEGYDIHEGEDDEFPHLGQNAWWFTWNIPGVDIEVGPTVHNHIAAWESAAEHWFENADIEVGRV